MNQKLLTAFGLILIVLVVVAGFLIFSSKPQSSSEISKQTEIKPTSGTSVFDSIKNALAKHMNISCDFTDESGRHVVSFVKNGAVRADISGKTAIDSQSVILKDKKIYFWNSKMAIMMDQPENLFPTGGQPTSISQQEQAVLNSIDKYKNSCKTESVNDNHFVIPTNVKFTDYSSMMKRNTTGASQSQEPMQQMMQKYQQDYQNTQTGQ